MFLGKGVKVVVQSFKIVNFLFFLLLRRDYIQQIKCEYDLL